MQALLLPAARNYNFTTVPLKSLAGSSTSALQLPRLSLRPVSSPFISPLNFESSHSLTSLSSSSSSSSGVVYPYEKLPLSIAKRLEKTARDFKRYGILGFWGQLFCTVMAAVTLAFPVVLTREIKSSATFYATAAGIAAAFISVCWSFGYMRLSKKLRKTANEPTKAPASTDVVKRLKNGIVVNLLGMIAAILGMEAALGLLVVKAIAAFGNRFLPGYNPFLALDLFLVQACAHSILSHFLGFFFSLKLLRSVTEEPSEATLA